MKGKLEFPLNIFSGRMGKKNGMYAFIRNGIQHFGIVGSRNFFEHPVTPREKETHSNMALASKAYNQLDKSSPEYKQLEQAFKQQRQYGIKHDKPYKSTLRGYFISQYIANLESTRNA